MNLKYIDDLNFETCTVVFDKEKYSDLAQQPFNIFWEYSQLNLKLLNEARGKILNASTTIERHLEELIAASFMDEKSFITEIFKELFLYKMRYDDKIKIFKQLTFVPYLLSKKEEHDVCVEKLYSLKDKRNKFAHCEIVFDGTNYNYFLETSPNQTVEKKITLSMSLFNEFKSAFDYLNKTIPEFTKHIKHDCKDFCYPRIGETLKKYGMLKERGSDTK